MLIVLIIFVVSIWTCSVLSVIETWVKNNVSINIISMLILICPIINTLLAIYYAYPTCKETLSKIFKKN